MGEPTKTKPRLVLGIRYKERKNNPPPGLEWRRVKDKETLESIAHEYGIRPIDLALYNWNTVKVDEINWYLYNFVGCREYKGKWYTFSHVADPKGWILVPDYPPAIKKGPPKSVDAVRNGASKLDSKLRVDVREWLASGEKKEVSGKWLYVFSGQSGINFGYQPPPGLPKKDAAPDRQPGSAFTLDFPGYFHLKEKPDKLEYEILITTNDGPSTSLLVALTGKQTIGKPHYEFGNKWYFLSDQTILQKATVESREKRTTHAYRNTKTVTIDLAPDGQNKRFYFLLSPVQLGPEAIKFAMSNPSGLTPLLKSDVEIVPNWDPNDPDQNVGPTPEDVMLNPIRLSVIDPYAWAENIDEAVYQDSLQHYVEWMSSKQNETLKELHAETGWTPDHNFVAQILVEVMKNHPNRTRIFEEFKDWEKLRKDLEVWEKKLVQRNAELNANAHRSLIQLIEWLDGPAHKIIETAILKDTTADSLQDAIDIGRGILHWAVCTEHMPGLAPGIDYLRDALNRPGTVPQETIFKHLRDLDKDTLTVKLKGKDQKGLQLGAPGVMRLLSLKTMISPPPSIPATGTQQEYQTKFADYQRKRRNNLISFLNENRILPGKVQPPQQLPSLPDGGLNWTTASTLANSTLDIVDKWTTYVIDPNIEIPMGKNRVLDQLAKLEKWFQKRPTFARIANEGSSYVLKGASTVIGFYNLYTAITTSRWDYQRNQSTVSKLDWASVSAGTTLVIQDLLTELAAVTKHAGMQRLFPQLMVTSGGPKYGVGAARVTIAGAPFATLNVVAMIVSGVTTMIMMDQSRDKAASRGDYTAAFFYDVGSLGGAMMIGGGVVFGLALLKLGGIFSATGAGATIGVLLFFVGGILAAVGTIFGSWFSSDDYQIFARKCFLGKEGYKEPRFESIDKDWKGVWVKSNEPPEWSHASKSGKNTWGIDKQKKAIINLLGRFSVKTKLNNFDPKKESYQGSLELEIKPGMFLPESTIEVALHYGGKGPQTTALIKWNPANKRKDYELKAGKDSRIFEAEQTRASIDKKKILVWLERLNYEMKKGELLTTVTIRLPDHDNVIRTRKLVIGHSISADPIHVLKRIKLKAGDGEETSGLYK